MNTPGYAHGIATGGLVEDLMEFKFTEQFYQKSSYKVCYLVGIYPISSYILQLTAIYAGAKNFAKCKAATSNRARMHTINTLYL